MLSEQEFLDKADELLARLAEAVEEADDEGVVEIEEEEGMVTLGLPAGRTMVVNRHTALREIWVSSPISGGLHFSWRGGHWMLANGTELLALLEDEIERLSGCCVQLA